LAVGSGRAETNSSAPSGVNTGCDSPLPDLVNRRGSRAPAGSISHSADWYFLPSGPGCDTAVTRRVPSGARARPPSRGVAMKWASSAKVSGLSAVCSVMRTLLDTAVGRS
jgi:hypothetical protein